jgi:DNA repair protein RadC
MERTRAKNRGDGHRKRLRERFLKNGLEGFQDYEVLELLLSLNTPRQDTKQQAKDLIKTFKSFHRVLEADTRSLCAVKGVGPANSFGIRLIKAAADRYLEARLVHRDVIQDQESLLAYLDHYMAHKDREIFLGIFLDAKNRVIETEALFRGSLTASAVYPREVISRALHHGAAAVIFAHNHPSGDTRPSAEDRRITRQLCLALKFTGIILHDHMIVGREGHYSFAAQGLVAEYLQEFERFDPS